MKKLISLLMAAVCLTGLLTGCRSAGSGPSGEGATTDPTETATVTQPTDTAATLPGADRGSLILGQTGKLRIPYTGNRSGVRYITDPSQLPDYPELKAYDEAYFLEHALVLVTETVTSGSVKVEIRSVTVENGVATVTLDHEIPVGLGTADMTTWLLWAEVDTGLAYTWNLENPAIKPQSGNNELY